MLVTLALIKVLVFLIMGALCDIRNALRQILGYWLGCHGIPCFSIHLYPTVELGEQKIPFIIVPQDFLWLLGKQLLITQTSWRGEWKDIRSGSLGNICVLFITVGLHVFLIRKLLNCALDRDYRFFVVESINAQTDLADRIRVDG